MTALVIQANAALPAALRDYIARNGGIQSEMASGIQSGFAVIGYKGKVWSFKYRGEEVTQVRPDDGTPKARLDLVVVKASPYVSKIFYKDGYVEGSTAAPDCWSADGIRPDASVPVKQNSNCAGCPMAQWGSKVTQQGKQNKACADSKRLAVVPIDMLGADGVLKEDYGGAMLLRVPAASLGDCAGYDKKMSSQGFPYFSLITAIQFDHQEAYPKFVFNPVNVLSEAQIAKVLELRDSEQVNRILSAPVEGDAAPAATPQGTVQPGVAAAATAATPVQPPVAPAPTLSQQATAPAPIPQAAVFQPVPVQQAQPVQPVQQAPQPVQQAPQPQIVDAVFAPVPDLAPVAAPVAAQPQPVAAFQQQAATPVAAQPQTAAVAPPVAQDNAGQGAPTDFVDMLDELLASPTT